MFDHLTPINAGTLAFQKLKGSVFLAAVALLAHPDGFSKVAQAEEAVEGGSSSLIKITTDDEKPAPVVARTGPADRERLDVQQAAIAAGTKPIYNRDDRKDWGQIRNESVQKRAKASIALFTTDSFKRSTSDSNKLILKARPLGEQQSIGGLNLPLCPGERFGNQLSGALCSGTLIADDLILTAGHCIREVHPDGVPVKDAVFVFGYTAKDKNDPGRSEFDRGDLFLGLEKKAGVFDSSNGEDWAVVRLARKVPKSVAEPVKQDEIQKSEKIATGAKVYVIGYPTGLPLKYAPNAEVKENTPEKYFITDLDTFGGNSGSGVYLHDHNTLVGILVRGETDYYPDPDPQKNCARAYRCPPYGCGGEDVVRTEIVSWP